MRGKRLGALIATAMAAGMLIAACGSGGGEDSTGSGGGSEAASSGSPSSGVKVGMSLKSASNPVWQAVAKGAEEEAEKLGVELIYQSGTAEENTSEQINIVETMLTQGVETLAIAPTGTGQMSPVLERAKSEGVPVVVLGTEAAGFSPTALVSTPQEELSEQVSKLLVQELHSGDEVGIVTYPEVSDVELRVDGTKNVLDGTGIKVAAELGGNCERAKALNSVTDMLQAHPKIAGIFGECGQNATGAIQAASNAGLKPGKDIKVVGFDGTPEELELIQSGEELATVLQDFKGLGAACVKTAVEAAEGNSVESEVSVPATLITQQNQSEFEAQGELVVPKGR